MKLLTNGVVFDTETSWLLQEHMLREKLAAEVRAGLFRPISTHWTSGIEQLYRRKDDGAFWVLERNSSDKKGIAIPLTDDAARAWLKDRFGHSRQFNQLEAGVFGQVGNLPPVTGRPSETA
jgi:hypothetical protein